MVALTFIENSGSSLRPKFITPHVSTLNSRQNGHPATSTSLNTKIRAPENRKQTVLLQSLTTGRTSFAFPNNFASDHCQQNFRFANIVLWTLHHVPINQDEVGQLS